MAVAAAIAPHDLRAQDAVQTQPSGIAEEPASDAIVVTARRREEKLQDVPMSVSVQSGESLVRANVDGLASLGKVTPGLTVTPSSRGGNTPNFVLRGQRTIDISIVLDPVIVTYYNDMPYMRAQGLNAALFDIQNVQVLRGPQGTLFGRNSTGGAVLVTTRPAVDRFEGNVALTLGSYDQRKLEGAINIPLGSRAAIRLAGVVNRRDGYVRNRLNGERYYDVHYDAQRLTFNWEPVDRLENTLYVNRYDAREHGAFAQIFGVLPTPTTLPVSDILQTNVEANLAHPLTVASDYVEPLRIRSDLPVREITRTYDINNTTTLDLGGGISLKNIFGFRHVKTSSVFDLDGSSAYIFRHVGLTDIDQYSDEFQVIGTGTKFDWIVGLFYFQEKGSDISNQVQATSPTIFRQSGIIAKNTSYSAFASATYRFSEALSLSAGARFTRDERENDGVQRVGDECGFRYADGTVATPPCLFHQKVSFEEPSWSVSLNYKVQPDLLVYAAHRHGYRSGGLQSRATTEAAAVPFRPEKVNDIELGVKYDLPGGGRVNADIYHAWYSNVQRQIAFYSPVSSTLVSGILNAATSKISGGEIEVLLKPATWLDLSGSAAYVHARYTKFLNGGVDISDTPYAFVPKWTLNGEATIHVPVADHIGDISAAASVRYQSKVYNSDTPQAFGWLPGFTLVDLRADWRGIMGTGFEAGVFVTNLFDERYYPFANNFTGSTGFVTRSIGAPRMAGVKLGYEF